MRAQKSAALHFYPNPQSQAHISFKLNEGENIIGNSLECDVVIAFPSISALHCKITIIDNAYYSIESLESTYGVFRETNGNARQKLKPEKEYELSSNQSIFLANKYECVFETLEKKYSQMTQDTVTPDIAEQSTLILEDIENGYEVGTPIDRNGVYDKSQSLQINCFGITPDKNGVEEEDHTPMKDRIEEIVVRKEEMMMTESQKERKAKNWRNGAEKRNNGLQEERDIEEEEKEKEQTSRRYSLRKRENVKENTDKEKLDKQNSETRKINKKVKVQKDEIEEEGEEANESLSTNEKDSQTSIDKRNLKVSWKDEKESGKLASSILTRLRRLSSRRGSLESPTKGKLIGKTYGSILGKRKADLESLSKYEVASTTSKKIKIDEEEPIKLKSALRSAEKTRFGNLSQEPKKEKKTVGKKKRTTRKSAKIKEEEENSSDNSLLNKYQIMFSGLNSLDPAVENDKKKLARLGAKIVEEKEKDFSLLVMDEFKRTIKFLLALSKGIDIVNYEWVKDSIKEKQLLPAEKYISIEKEAEKKYKFKLSSCLEKAKKRETGLLNDYEVYLPANLKPSTEEIKMLVQSLGGSVVKAKPTSFEEDMLVILDEDDTKSLKQFVGLGFQPYSTELVYSCILQQKLNLNQAKLHCKK